MASEFPDEFDVNNSTHNIHLLWCLPVAVNKQNPPPPHPMFALLHSLFSPFPIVWILAIIIIIYYYFIILAESDNTFGLLLLNAFPSMVYAFLFPRAHRKELG